MCRSTRRTGLMLLRMYGMCSSSRYRQIAHNNSSLSRPAGHSFFRKKRNLACDGLSVIHYSCWYIVWRVRGKDNETASGYFQVNADEKRRKKSGMDVTKHSAGHTSRSDRSRTTAAVVKVYVSLSSRAEEIKRSVVVRFVERAMAGITKIYIFFAGISDGGGGGWGG